MMNTGQRTNVHGILDAGHEWQRIVELAFKSGLGAVPATRPEFALTQPARGNDHPSDEPAE